MRVIVCDDDELVRSVIATIIEERGLTLVGEAEDELGALDLLETANPDIAIIDLALKFSSGLEVVRIAWERGCRVVIYSSYVTPEQLNAAPGGPVAVEKPHFDRLAVALEQVANSVTAQAEERRANDRSQHRLAATFAQAVSEATAGDAIVILEPPPGQAQQLDVVGLTVARTTASQDRHEITARHLRLLLVCAGEGGARAVIDRVQAQSGVDLSSWSQRIAVVSDTLTGIDAYEQVRSPTATA